MEPQLKEIWDRRFTWTILVAVLSTWLFSSVVSGTITAFLFTVLMLKPSQPMPAVNTAGEAGPEIPTGNLSDNPEHLKFSGFFHKARNFVLQNPIMTYMLGEDKTPRIMELLLNYIIIGAAHDDSARNHPPKCHPGTRVKILERLMTWFNDVNRAKSLLWLCGPAGVGKSAIVQTFAESVGQLVASIFISRPNKRNDPNRIFITIAYQLAVHFAAYRNYLVERIAANPYILNKNMHIQFQVFITEPFVDKKIGAGGPPLAILLDGLDEVDGVDAQRDIIRLISLFTQEHPDAPLAWIISSRSESHINHTFNETTIQDSFVSESIPIDSTEACEDVERFLRDRFDTVRCEFPDTATLTNWPEETALAKLAVAASGLFVFAETAVRFVRDPDHANPIHRLKLVLRVIDRSKKVSSVHEQPFRFLDNLYTEILSNIPSGLLPTTKRLIRLALSFRSDDFLGLSRWSKSRTLRGMALLLQLDRHTVYAALSKCFSTLKVPLWQEAHQETLMFLHASFADYLTDSERSGNFYIDVDGVEDDVLLVYLKIWHKYFKEGPEHDVSLFDEDDDNAQIAPETISAFNISIFTDMARSLVTQIVERHKPCPEVSPALKEKRLECLSALRKVNMIDLCNSKYMEKDHLYSFVKMTFDSWKKFPQELGESGILRQVSLKEIDFDYRDKKMYITVYRLSQSRLRFTFPWFSRLRSASKATVEIEKDPRELFLDSPPDLPVLICGTVPVGRVALFRANEQRGVYFIVQYRK